MLGSYQYITQPRRPVSPPASSRKLIGYMLSAAKNCEQGRDALLRLEEKSSCSGFILCGSESDIGVAANPIRMGLWRALRKMICNRCEPKRMPFSLLNFNDFLHQALSACPCGQPQDLSGMVVQKLAHITNDNAKMDAIILEFAKRNKHLVAEDNICLSCCHPAIRNLIGKPV